MTEREKIQALLSDVYAARARNDVPAILKSCTPDVRYQMAGSGETFAAAKAEGQAEFSVVLDTLFKTFELIDYQIQGITVDGSNATVHWRGNFRSGVTGETAETEIVDVIRVHEGRIVSVIQFCDTALAHRMMGI